MDALGRILRKVEADSHWSSLLKPQAKKLYDALSADLKDLLNRMLEIDEGKRATMDDVLRHAWLQRPLPTALGCKLEELRLVQQMLDGGAAGTRPKYSERDGGKLIEEIVQYVFTEEYEAESVRLLRSGTGCPESTDCCAPPPPLGAIKPPGPPVGHFQHDAERITTCQ